MESTGGLFFSQKVLLALIDAGLSRDDAYAIVQRAAAETWERGAHFKEAVWSELSSKASPPLSKEAFDALFKVKPFVEHLDGVFARVEKLEVAEP